MDMVGSRVGFAVLHRAPLSSYSVCTAQVIAPDRIKAIACKTRMVIPNYIRE
jgi:hypothetical protein